MFPWNMSVTPVGRWRSTALTQAVGATVDSWGDLLGGCGNLVQTISSDRQPTVRLSPLINKPTVVFDGSNDFLKVTFPAGISQPYCYFFVLKSSAAAGYFVDGVESSASTHRAFVTPGWAYGAPTYRAGTASDLTWHRGVACFNNAGSSYLRIDGTNVTTSGPGTNSTTGITLGSQWDQTGGTFTAYSIAELLVCSGAPSADDLAKWDAYVAAEYGFPLTLSGISPRGWWKASAIQQASGTAVATWTDLIGGCGDLVQTTASKQPVVTANQVNGKPAVVFDGVDDHFLFAAGSPVLTTMISEPAGIWFLCRAPTADAGHSYALIDGADLGTRWVLRYSGGQYMAGDTIKYGTIDTNAHSILEHFNPGGSALYVDGVTLASLKSFIGNPLGTCAPRIGIGSDAAAYPWSGWITEIMVYQGTPTADDIAKLEAYVQQEYGF